MRWANYQLDKQKEFITNLDGDIESGVVLIKLVQQLSGKDITGSWFPKPALFDHRLENFRTLFDFVASLTETQIPFDPSGSHLLLPSPFPFPSSLPSTRLTKKKKKAFAKGKATLDDKLAFISFLAQEFQVEALLKSLSREFDAHLSTIGAKAKNKKKKKLITAPPTVPKTSESPTKRLIEWWNQHILSFSITNLHSESVFTLFFRSFFQFTHWFSFFVSRSLQDGKAITALIAAYDSNAVSHIRSEVCDNNQNNNNKGKHHSKGEKKRMTLRSCGSNVPVFLRIDSTCRAS